ncbi:hypothetical protein GOODEAATRI_017623 [Goodea atripinnis]|uniref:Uncharacterized protein n=1 Tax=Goodea atripinnis TaxID=208336 RepID=A0ABV0PPG3_9TELE
MITPLSARAPHVRRFCSECVSLRFPLPLFSSPLSLSLFPFSRGISTSVFLSSSLFFNSAESTRPPPACRTESERLEARLAAVLMLRLLRATHRDASGGGNKYENEGSV